jgi:hypothetical protein
MDPQSNVFFHTIKDFPRNVTLLISQASLRNLDGDYMGIGEGIYNHHISMQNINKRALPFLACPPGSGFPGVGDMPVTSVAGVGEDG